MQVSHDASEHALRFQLAVFAVETHQVMQIERSSWALNHLAVAIARGQVRVAQRRVGRDFVKKNIHTNLRQPMAHRVRPHSCCFCCGNIGADD